jgi:hypothetical protein
MEGIIDAGVRADYPDPVSRLLQCGETDESGPADWPDYVSIHGFGPRDVPGLIRMATDLSLHRSASDSDAVWAPVHAWRALGQLRAEGAIEPLVALFQSLDEDEVPDTELADVLAMIGPAAIEPLGRFLSDPSTELFPRAGAMDAVQAIAKRHPDHRAACIDLLVRILEPDQGADSTLVGFAISRLMDIHAVEAIDTIRDAYRRDAVDLSIVGDVEDVEIEFGLRPARQRPRQPYRLGRDLLAPFTEAPPPPPADPVTQPRAKVGRNEPCPCGSGKKYKKCCL